MKNILETSSYREEIFPETEISKTHFCAKRETNRAANILLRCEANTVNLLLLSIISQYFDKLIPD